MSQQERPKAGAKVSVSGILTDQGVECQAFQGDDHRLYTIGGDLHGLKAGDRVRVTGTVQQMSVCQQGITLSVESIEKE